MFSFLVIGVVVVLATAMWPLNRWAMRRGARPAAVGVAISVAGIAIGLLVAAASGQPLVVPAALGLGSLAGVAYSVGFVLIIFHCLRIGPAGPTVLVNNLGMVWPIAIGMVWFAPGATPLAHWLGLGCIAVTLALTGLGQPAGPAQQAGGGGRWGAWVLAGWVFSGVSMGCPFLASQYAPAAPLAFLVAMYVVSGLILLGVLLVQRAARPQGFEILAGLGTGTMVTGSVALTIWVLTRMSPVVVFPVTVAGPIVLMMLIGAAAFKERIGWTGWLAAGFGIAGIALLALP
jgi:drug/metabolite transporter (DMT)-like permease